MTNHTDAAARAAKAVLELINSSPRTPSEKKLAASIAQAIREEPNGSGHADTYGGDFGPLLGSDDKPLEFEFTNKEFTDTFLPWIRMAFITIGQDREGVIKLVRGFADSPDAENVFEAVEAWEIISNKFGAIAKFVEDAWLRVMTVTEKLVTEDSDIGRALSRGADKYLPGLEQRSRGLEERLRE